MSALFIGGIKSGKSFLAEKYALAHAKSKPIYLATTEFIDSEMKKRITQHQEQRQEQFITVEEPLKLFQVIQKSSDVVLIECVSMWINNMLYYQKSFEDMQEEIRLILKEDKELIFVLNDVGAGIIPDNKLAREFIDISGKISQLIAKEVDEVFHVIAGIGTKIK